MMGKCKTKHTIILVYLALREICVIGGVVLEVACIVKDVTYTIIQLYSCKNTGDILEILVRYNVYSFKIKI